MNYHGKLINSLVVVNRTYDKWGEIAGTTSTTEICRIEYTNKVVRDFRGQEVVSRALVFLLAGTVAVPDSILTFDGRDNAILTYEKIQDSVKIHHIEAYVA